MQGILSKINQTINYIYNKAFVKYSLVKKMKIYPGNVKRSRRPYEVGRFIHHPNATPYFFHVVLKPETLLQVGVLYKILSAVVGEQVPLLLVKVSTPIQGNPIRVLLAVHLKGGKQTAERIVKELKNIPGVEEVEYAPPLFDGVALDMWSFPLTFSGDRAIILRNILFESMLREGWERLGGSFGALLYCAFFKAGQELYSRFYSKYKGEGGDPIRLAEELFRLFGYGILEFVKLTDKEAVVRVYDSFECNAFKGAGEPRGAIVRGLLAGWAAAYWGASRDEITVKEEKCIAKGDPYCQYHFYRI